LATVKTTAPGRTPAATGGTVRRVARLAGTTPRRYAILLGASILVAVLMAVSVLVTYASINDTVTAAGQNAAPSIVAADHLQALAASADANALNAVVTRSAPDAYAWSQYRKDVRAAYEELTIASQYTAYGFAQVGPIQVVESTLSQYDNTVGQLQAQTAANLPSNPLAGHTMMVRQILPARLTLVRTDSAHLDRQYAAYQDAVGGYVSLVWITFLALLVLLVWTQLHLYRRSHRIINPGYAAATVITLGCMIYFVGAFNAGQSQLAHAKEQSFSSVNALWSVRATAFLMNADESLYLLNAHDPKTLAAVEQDFTQQQQQIVAIDPQLAVEDAQKGVPFGGLLGDRLAHAAYPGEAAADRAAVQTFAKYVAVDNQVRQLLAEGNTQQAQALVLGFNPNQAALAFTQFDSALWNTIDINQFQFDQQIASANSSLAPVPWVLGIALLALVAATILGMKPRLDEYQL
jgi:hypothetical protein